MSIVVRGRVWMRVYAQVLATGVATGTLRRGVFRSAATQ